MIALKPAYFWAGIFFLHFPSISCKIPLTLYNHHSYIDEVNITMMIVLLKK